MISEMTKMDRIARIDAIDTRFVTYEIAEEIAELREGIKLSDLFDYKGADEIRIDFARKILGRDEAEKVAKMAVDGGYISVENVRLHGAYINYYRLTKIGRNALKRRR